MDYLLVGGIAAGLIVALVIDLKFFAPSGEATFKQAAWWSVGWLVISLAAAFVIAAFQGVEDGVLYATVYLIERSLSLDNVFVFLLLFAYFAVPEKQRGRLIFYGVVLAVVMRGLAILGGIALIERFHFVLYLLGVALLILAYKMFKGVGEEVDPGKNLAVRLVRKFFPVTSTYHEGSWFVRIGDRLHATPLLLALAGVVFADIVFAVDSIPAAFAITREPLLIWLGNVFALLGLRALFVLVDRLVKRFRYLDQTIALVLGVIAVKLLIEDFVHIGPLASLAIVGSLFTGGIVASLIGDRRDPAFQQARLRALEEQKAKGVDLPVEPE